MIHSSERPDFVGRYPDASDFIPPLYTSPHFILVSILQYRRYPRPIFHTCFSACGMWGRVDMRYYLAPYLRMQHGYKSGWELSCGNFIQ